MRKSLFRYIFRMEYVLASLLVAVMVWCVLLLSESLPETDETSFLSPILDRFDFLNIADVSLDAIFAVKDAEFPDERIKVVNVGEVAPTPDGKIAMLLYKLHAAGARVIGLDIFLDEQHVERFTDERKPEFEALVQALRDVPNVVVASAFDQESMQPDFELDPHVLDAGPAQGFANLPVDQDGVVRRFLPRADVGGEQWLGLPVRMLQIYDPGTVEKLLRLPAEPQIIYYTGTYFQFESVPIDDVVFGEMYDGDFFRDAIVLVGFVNEGGLFYLNDTHKTPMGRKIDVEGPDMPGILIHANVINMLLKGRFIAPVPMWVDWLLVFLMSYLSIALYRVLRTKAPNSSHVAMLITVMLFSEAVIIFFLPLIAFFYFDVKISYHLMATGLVLFIPAGALVTKLQFMLERKRMTRGSGNPGHGIPAVLHDAFEDDEPFVSHVRLLHGCLCGVQFAWSQQTAALIAQGITPKPGFLLPGLQQWREALPVLESDFSAKDSVSRQRQYFLRYLDGKKDEFLHESAVKELFFTTELPTFNPFLSFEEWELMLPYARRLLTSQLRPMLQAPIFSVTETGIVHVQVDVLESEQQGSFRELQPGLYGTMQFGSTTPFRLSPFCEWAECKLHREVELFIFAGLVKRQYALESVPVYYGRGPSCEPMLPPWTIETLRDMEIQEQSLTDTRGMS